MNVMMKRLLASAAIGACLASSAVLGQALVATQGNLPAATQSAVSSAILYGFNGTTYDPVRAGAVGGNITNNANGNVLTAALGYSQGSSNWEQDRTAVAFPITGKKAVQAEEGYSSNLNVSAATTVKATVGRIFKVNVIVAGATGQICDANAACGAATVVFQIPAVVGTYDLNWPMLTGIRVEPGAGQTVAVSWN